MTTACFDTLVKLILSETIYVLEGSVVSINVSLQVKNIIDYF